MQPPNPKLIYSYAILLLICNLLIFLLLQFGGNYISTDIYDLFIIFYSVTGILLMGILWLYVVKIKGQQLSFIVAIIYVLAMLAELIVKFLPEEFYNTEDRMKLQLIQFIPTIIETLAIIFISIQLIRNALPNSKKRFNMKLYGYSILITLILTMLLPVLAPVLFGMTNLSFLRYTNFLLLIPIFIAFNMYYSELNDQPIEEEELLIDSDI